MKPTPKPIRKPLQPRSVTPSNGSYRVQAPELEGDPLAKLLPKLNPKQRELAGQLMARGGDIQKWFTEDPNRVHALQTDPYETINSLARALDLALPVVDSSELPGVTVVFNPFDCVCTPPHDSLYTAVWQFIGASAANLSAWNADPLSVIDQIAANTGASEQEANTLKAAFRQVFSLNQSPSNPLASIPFLQGIRPKQLIIR